MQVTKSCFILNNNNNTNNSKVIIQLKLPSNCNFLCNKNKVKTIQGILMMNTLNWSEGYLIFLDLLKLFLFNHLKTKIFNETFYEKLFIKKTRGNVKTIL